MQCLGAYVDTKQACGITSDNERMWHARRS